MTEKKEYLNFNRGWKTLRCTYLLNNTTGKTEGHTDRNNHISTGLLII